AGAATLLEQRHEEFARGSDETGLALDELDDEGCDPVAVAPDDGAQRGARLLDTVGIVAVVKRHVVDGEGRGLAEAVIRAVGDLGHRAGPPVEASAEGDHAGPPAALLA